MLWIDSTWSKRGGEPVVEIYARDREGEVRKICVRGFRPYFWAPGGEEEDLLGRKVHRVYVKLPSDVREERRKYEWTDEADVPFDMRFMIDAGIYDCFDEKLRPVDSEDIELVKMYFDIEVDADRFPDVEKAEWPIVMIQVLVNDGRRKIFTTLPWRDEDVVNCANERELIGEWMKFVREVDPDVMLGWNSNQFDWPYIFKRCAKLRLPTYWLSRGGRPLRVVRMKSGEWRVRIVGRQCVDMLEMFKKWYKAKGELESWSLKYVAKVILGYEYSEEDVGARIRELIEREEWERIFKYARDDVEVLGRIDATIGLVDFYEHLRRFAGVKLEDSLKNSKIIETLIMRKATRPMPTRVYSEEEEDEGYQGALVLSPPIGVHENVGVFDLKSLYPSIIVAFDVSPDVEKIIPKVLREVMEEREKLREMRLQGAGEVVRMKEVVVKFIACSFYGVMGWRNFRLYSKEHAAFITEKGRELILSMKEWIERELQKNVVYGDTDSVFVDKVFDVEEGMRVQDFLNAKLREWGEEKGMKIPPEVKFEKLFRRILFKKKTTGKGSAKKRYAGWLVWEDGREKDEIKMVGLETKRSDSADITKELMEEFMRAVLREGDVGQFGRKVREVMKGMDRMPIAKIAIPKGVKKKEYANKNAWVVGMENATKLLGITFRSEQKPRLVYCRRPVDKICVTEDMEKLPDWIEIDWWKMQEVVIKRKFRVLMESIGLSWDAIVEGQRSLGDFGF